MKKEIEFKAKFDTAEFDKSVEQMQKKLSQMYAPADQIRAQSQTGGRMEQSGFGGIMSPASKAAFDRASQQAKRTSDEEIRKTAQNQESMAKELIRREKLIDNLRRKQDEVTKGSEKELEIRKKIGETESKNAMMREQYLQKDKVLNQMLDAKDRQNAGQGSQGGSGGIDIKNIMKGLQTGLAIIATASAVYDNYSSIPIRRSAAAGNAAQSFVGGELNRDVISQQAWSGERGKAMEMARKKNAASEKVDTGLAMSGIGGLASGIGSMFGGGNGTAYDTMMGGITGSISKSLPQSFIGGMPGVSGLAKKLGEISENYMSSYAAKKAEEFGQNYQQISADEVKKNPLKNLAVTQFQANYSKDLDAQRLMGLNYDSYHGRDGFQQASNMAGFSSDMGVGMANTIGGAGGSTRGMRGSSIMGMQMARGMDLTNSGGILGQISGYAGSSQATNSIAMKIMEESVKNGLDKSDFRAENRKFTEIAAGVLARSGARTEGDVSNVMSGFSKLVGGQPTMAGITGASQAYEEYQGLGSSTSGRFGAMQYASMLKDPSLSKLGAQELGPLMELNPDQITETNSSIIAYARKAGLTPKALADKIKAAKQNGVTAGAQVSDADSSSVSKWMSDNGKTSMSQITGDDTMGMSQEVYNAYTKVRSSSAMIYGKGSDEKMNANAMSLLPTAAGPDGSRTNFVELTPGDKVAQALGGKKTGRNEDDVVTSMATQSQAFLENFRNFAKEITPASDAIDKFTKKIILLSSALSIVPEADKAGAARAIGESLYPSQTQAGKPQPGNE